MVISALVLDAYLFARIYRILYTAVNMESNSLEVIMCANQYDLYHTNSMRKTNIHLFKKKFEKIPDSAEIRGQDLPGYAIHFFGTFKFLQLFC